MFGRINYVGAICVGLTLSASARGQFVPGHVYVADPPPEPCPTVPGYPHDRIWDVDPVTGQAHVFATLPAALCGQINGLVFTPDGSRLRTTNFLRSTVLELDPQGNASIVYGPPDGIAAPFYGNDMAYDAAGDFYVVQQGAHNILKFPAGGGPAAVFADVSDGVVSGGPIAIGPNGDVYYSSVLGPVLRFDPAGNPTPFFTLPPNTAPHSMAADDVGNVFLLLSGGVLYRIPGANPAAPQVLASSLSLGAGTAITVSPDDSKVYFAANAHLVSVDVVTGAVLTEANIPAQYTTLGSGIAFYVPEPTSLALVLLGAGVALGRVRARPAVGTVRIGDGRTCRST